MSPILTGCSLDITAFEQTPDSEQEVLCRKDRKGRAVEPGVDGEAEEDMGPKSLFLA